MKKMSSILTSATLIILCIVNFSVAATEYPSKPITLILPTAPGGIGDLFGRGFASVTEKLLGKPIVVVNKPGASGQLGLTACVQAAPDGHTLAVSACSDLYAMSWEMMNGRKPLVTRNDLIYIGAFTKSPHVITVPYNSPWKTLADLINDGKAKPDHYAFGSGGQYGAVHVLTEILMRTAGLKFRHVPYAGGGQIVSALVGNHIDFATTTAGSTIPLARGQKVRILAVTGETRYRLIPDIPTAKELGIDMEFYGWIGIVASQKTPATIVEKLSEVFKKVTEDKSFINVVENAGEVVNPMDKNELAKFMDMDLERVEQLYKQLIQEKK